MRISVLLKREPFGLILEKTLSHYWSNLLGSSVRVSWGESSSEKYLWKGNIFLNFFCTYDADQSCFHNIIREYGYSSSYWRRGLQSLYVRAAVTPPFRHYLSQVSFRVSREFQMPIKLVIGGRNRRIIHQK